MRKTGYLEVIAGPMYCGKTEELIRQVRRASIGKKRVQVFKHAMDVRYGKEQKLYSHAGLTFSSELVKSAGEILNAIDPKTELIAIDEAQWFGDELVALIWTLLEKGYHVIVAGLAMTYDRQPFIPMPALMAMADKVTKLSAVCSICGNDAVFHKRVINGNVKDALSADPRLVAGLNAYQARCRKCFNKK